MIDPSLLRASLVENLQKIDPLIALFDGDTTNILEYVEEENGDLLNTIFGLNSPKMIVVYQGTNPVGGQRSMWQHNFSFVFRVPTSPTAVLAAIVSGTVTGGSGLPFVFDTIHPAYEPMTLPTMRRAVIPVSDRASKDYWEITTSLNSRGIE
jgi:hypothetical protein